MICFFLDDYHHWLFSSDAIIYPRVGKDKLDSLDDFFASGKTPIDDRIYRYLFCILYADNMLEMLHALKYRGLIETLIAIEG